MQRLLLPLLVACLVLVSAPVASADSAPIRDDGSLPWTNPSHQSPLEVLAGEIASEIAGRPVSVRCHGDYEWSRIASPGTLGFVAGYYDAATDTWAADATLVYLGPGVCSYLNRFALASPKPTKCEARTTVLETVWRTVTVRTTVKVKVNGKLVTKVVTTRKRVPHTVEKQATGPPAPCYLGNGKRAAGRPASYWQEYGEYAHSILTLAHESIHLQQIRAGLPARAVDVDEAEAGCYGIQWIARVAQRLGAAADDGQTIAAYYYEELSGARDTPDCVPGGALDLSPADGIWP